MFENLGRAILMTCAKRTLQFSSKKNGTRSTYIYKTPWFWRIKGQELSRFQCLDNSKGECPILVAGHNLVAVGGTDAAWGAVILVANAREVSMRGIPSAIHAPHGGGGGQN